jgi:hypothetical protein
MNCIAQYLWYAVYMYNNKNAWLNSYGFDLQRESTRQNNLWQLFGLNPSFNSARKQFLDPISASLNIGSSF